jgi:ATPase subunit of ABC transporter with duplicated ATPase domains
MPPPSAFLASLTARRLNVERGGRPVLDDISLTVGPDTRLGVVGPNGVGKSTLLQVLAGLLASSSGEVRVDPPTATVGYLRQEHAPVPGETVRDALLRQTGVASAEDELARAAAGLATAAGLAAAAGGDTEHTDRTESGGTVGGPTVAAERYATALARYESMSAGNFESRLVTTFEEVGLPEHVAGQDSGTLSGGQAARVALATILLSRFDITMLDEPTNDLDFDGLARLERLVQRRSGALIVVSHDRAFLDRAVTDVFELDEHTRNGRVYGGGWSGYLSERAAEQAHADEAYAVYTAQRDDLRQRAQRERQWATKGVAREKKSPRDNDKAQRDFRINRTEKQASRARRTERALATLEVVDKPWEGWELQFSINEATRSGAIVVRLEEAVIEREDFRLGPFTLDIEWADRVALVGPNGTGKTTLVEAILGRLPLTAGTRRMGPSVVVGELGQDRRLLRDASTLLDAFRVAAPGLRPDLARAQLAKFGLGAEAVTRPPSSLSPGERTRAELAAFAASGVNLLVLDEPTNHLDLPAIEQLESALDSYGGTLVLVSHDRRLLEEVRVTRTITLPLADDVLRGLREEH